MVMDYDSEQPVPPVTLYQCKGRSIYWLGVCEPSAFRCNAYLIRDGDTGVLVDPGGRNLFPSVRASVEKILPVDALTGMILCHQDPDVAGSMVDWLDINPSLTVFTTPRTQVLLPYNGRSGYEWHDVEAKPTFSFPSGATLHFILAPFLHFPGAFVTFDPDSGFLFSGDIWAALDFNWRLRVASFEDHVPQMDLFHTEYMASNVAARGFVRHIEHLPIAAILPQHGSILPREMVRQALDYLRNLRCGLDIIYADLL
jgi:flavorubredoxin